MFSMFSQDDKKTFIDEIGAQAIVARMDGRLEEADALEKLISKDCEEYVEPVMIGSIVAIAASSYEKDFSKLQKNMVVSSRDELFRFIMAVCSPKGRILEEFAQMHKGKNRTNDEIREMASRFCATVNVVGNAS